MKQDVDWHIIYEGSALTCNSWIEEVAYLGNEQWLLRLYDDPVWTFEAEEPMQPEKKTSDELVAWVRYMDSVSDKDSFTRPRQKSLYDVAIDLGATRCVELLSSIRMSSQKENTEVSKLGKEIFRSGNISLGPASPDHPIYKSGFVIGGRQLEAVTGEDRRRRRCVMTYFIIDDGQLYNGRQKVTHVRRVDGGGIEYLKLWVSDEGNVLVGRTVGEAMFTLTVTPDGDIEGEVPGGYQYKFVAGE